MKEPRFMVDVMLGGLAKWLRILGFDTLYFKDIDDNEIIKIVKQQQRVLLTRDTGLAKNKILDGCILIKSNKTLEQLKEFLNIFPLKYSLTPRCAKCNGELIAAERESVADNVPEHVLLNFNSFFKCRNCGKVYWEGSHKKLINIKLQEIQKEIDICWES